MMQSRWNSTLQLRIHDLFYLEQWLALLLGITCVGAGLWAGFSAPGSIGPTHQLGLGSAAFAVLKNCLILFVASVGMALLRFAFYNPPEKPAGDESTPTERPLQKDQRGRESHV